MNKKQIERNHKELRRLYKELDEILRLSYLKWEPSQEAWLNSYHDRIVAEIKALPV